MRSFRESKDKITFNDQEKRGDATGEIEDWPEIWWRGTQESVMPQKPRQENVSGRESLVVSKSAERLKKMKTRNQLLHLASLKSLKYSFKKMMGLKPGLEWIHERIGNKEMDMANYNS